MDAGQHHGPVTAPPMAEGGWGTGPLSGFMGPPRGSLRAAVRADPWLAQRPDRPCHSPAGRFGPWSRRTGAPNARPRPGQTGADQIRGCPVRPGSARHRDLAVLGGHQRSGLVGKDPRSQGLHADNLLEESGNTAGSNPTSRAAAGRRPLPTRQASRGVRPHPLVQVVPKPPGCSDVVLAGRATTVPFTAVAIGTQR